MTTFDFIKTSLRENTRQYMMAFALLAIWLIFAFATDGIFITPRNLSNLFLQTVTVAIAAAGMTLIIVTGNIDLSVGSVAGFTGALCAVLQVKHGWSTPAALAAGIAAGAAIGAWHGFWVAYKKIPAFIVTLASMLAFRGAILGVTGGATISPLSGSFKSIGQSYLPRIWSADSAFSDSSALFALACIGAFIFLELRKRGRRMEYGLPVNTPKIEAVRLFFYCSALAAVFAIMTFNQGIPYSVILLLAVSAALSFVAGSTVFGRRLYAIGGNSEAARLSGINTEKNILGLFVLFGGLTALSGIVMTARLNAATTSAGTNMELDAIAAAVIGGTSLLGGEGTITGALIGALIMSSLDNGMSLMNMDITYQYIIKGLILLAAVWADISAKTRH